MTSKFNRKALSTQYCWLTFACALCSSAASRAAVPTGPIADLSVQAAVSSRRPYLGEPVLLQITVKQSVEKFPEVDAAALEPLGVKQVGEPSRGHSRSEEFTISYQYQFTPARAGRLTIPALTVRQGKETAATQPMEIEVIGPEEQDWAHVEIVPSYRGVYPGQSITLSVHILLKRLVHQGELIESNPFSNKQPPHVKISWIGGTELLQASRSLGETLNQRARAGGPGFPVNDLFQETNLFSLFDDRATQATIRFDRDEVERDQEGNKVAYYRYTLPLEYRAVRAGTVGPLVVQLRGPVYTEVRRGVRGLEAEHTNVFAVSPPLTLTITPVPKAGQPPTFTGGVGTFRATATAAPIKLRVGDPITLTLRVTGTGTLEDVGPPNLTAQEKWTRDFKIHEDPSQKLEEGAKVFTYSLRPKHAEVRELPAIRLGYFDPKVRKYEETFTDRIPLEVSETARLNSSEIVDAAPEAKANRELEEVGAGLAANYTGPDVLEPEGAYQFASATWVALVLSPPLLWVTALVWHWRMDFRRRNPAWLRAQSAHRRAMERLEAVARLPADLQPEEAVRSLAGYLADRLNLPVGELTPLEARQQAMALGAEPALADRVSQVVERFDQARFARLAGGSDPATLIASVREILRALEQAASENGRRPRIRRLGVAATVWLAAGFLVAWSPAAPLTEQSEKTVARHAKIALANTAFARGARAEDAATAQQAFQEAIAEYLELIADGVESGKLYYNLGNAYFRVGDVPRAILNYRLAQRLRPRDDQIAANLAFARSRVADGVEPTQTSRLLRQLLFAHYTWSIRERTQTALAAFWVAWLLLGVRIWLPRRWLTAGGIASIAVATSLAVSASRQFADQRVHPIGVLVADEVVVRKGDGETYEPQFNRSLGAGIEFRVIEQRGDWLQIELPDWRTGWVKVEQVVVSSTKAASGNA